MFIRDNIILLLEGLPFKSQAHCEVVSEVRSTSKFRLIPWHIHVV